jgi:hypothetical protein
MGTYSDRLLGDTQRRLRRAKNIYHIYRLLYAGKGVITALTQDAIACLPGVDRNNSVTSLQQRLHAPVTIALSTRASTHQSYGFNLGEYLLEIAVRVAVMIDGSTYLLFIIIKT